MKVNKFAPTIIIIIVSIITIGYLKDFTNQNINLFFVLTVVVTFIVYFKQKDGTIFKYVSILRITLMYCIVVFGDATSQKTKHTQALMDALVESVLSIEKYTD